MLKKTSVFCREQQQSQQTWLQSRNCNPTLPETGVSISNSSSFGYWSALLSSPLILSRLLTLSSATQSQMLTIAEHLKISQSQWGEFHSGKHNVWKNRKLNLRKKREKAYFFTRHALPQVASQAYGCPQLRLILRDVGVTQRKLVIGGHPKNTRSISNLLINSNLQFSLSWLIVWSFLVFFNTH